MKTIAYIGSSVITVSILIPTQNPGVQKTRILGSITRIQNYYEAPAARHRGRKSFKTKPKFGIVLQYLFIIIIRPLCCLRTPKSRLYYERLKKERQLLAEINHFKKWARTNYGTIVRSSTLTILILRIKHVHLDLKWKRQKGNGRKRIKRVHADLVTWKWTEVLEQYNFFSFLGKLLE